MRCTFVVISYKSSKHLAKLLPVLSEVSDAEILIWENASGDLGLEQCLGDFPAVRLIESTENLGFARAVNKAVALAESELIFLINPDTVPTLDNLIVLLEKAEDLRGDFVLAPAIPSQKGHGVTLSAGNMPTTFAMFCHMFPIGEFAKSRAFQLRTPARPSTEKVDWVSGAAMIFTKNTFTRVDGMSERWFMYAEDIDFCRRVRESGGQVLHDGTVELFHEIGGSDTGGRQTVWLENLQDYFRIYHARGSWDVVLWKTVVASGMCLRYIFGFFRSVLNKSNNFDYRYYWELTKKTVFWKRG